MNSWILNIVFGLFPTFALGWSMAADELKATPERVVTSAADARQQQIIFLLVYGLWALTLSMWNWMRSESHWWIALWLAAGVAALAACLVVRSVGRRG
ncbi:MAG TPA: hypothetical protein VHL58_09065 [Thermoanaerobaculia bacterium]|nr:hypothetical protein [Thermoanaerobaculia bacterium]